MWTAALLAAGADVALDDLANTRRVVDMLLAVRPHMAPAT